MEILKGLVFILWITMRFLKKAMQPGAWTAGLAFKSPRDQNYTEIFHSNLSFFVSFYGFFSFFVVHSNETCGPRKGISQEGSGSRELLFWKV